MADIHVPRPVNQVVLYVKYRKFLVSLVVSTILTDVFFLLYTYTATANKEWVRDQIFCSPNFAAIAQKAQKLKIKYKWMGQSTTL